MSMQPKIMRLFIVCLLAAGVGIATTHWFPIQGPGALTNIGHSDEFNGAIGKTAPMPSAPMEAKKTARYEAVIANWKRHRIEKQIPQ
jgi:hypothetical protein